MTLEEAIKHAEEVAQEKGYEYQECLAVHDMEEAMDCRKCGEEHEQLAAWLRELQARRKQPEIVRCGECKHRDPEDKKCDCGHDIIWQLPRDDDWFCADAERRTE